MTSIFVSHAQADDVCAEQIRLGLIAQGYTIQQKSPALTLESLIAARTIETLILGSVAVVLLWSQQAAQSVEVQKQAAFAQHMKKPLVTVALDATPLPGGLVAQTTLPAQLPCTDVVPHLLPFLPSVQHSDALTTLGEQAAHEHIHVRKEAIELATTMLARDEQREAVLAILDYLAQHDLISSVREKAQEALRVATQPQ